MKKRNYKREAEQELFRLIINKTKRTIFPPFLTINPGKDKEEIVKIENMDWTPGKTIIFTWYQRLEFWFLNKFYYRLK